MLEKREQDLDVRDYLTILGRRQWLIIMTMVTVIVATAFYTWTQTPQFQAESRVLLRSPYMPYGDESGGMMSLGMGALSQSYDIDTEIERIKNPELVKETRERLSPRLRNSPLGGLAVRQIGRTAIIAISVTSPNAEFAAQLSRELAAAYIEHTRRMRQVATEQALKYVEEQAGKAKADLDTADAKISAFKQTSGVIDIETGGGRTLGRYETLLDQIEKGQTEARIVGTQLAALEGQRKAVDPARTAQLTALPDSGVGQMRAQLQQLMGERLTALNEYTETSHRVRDLDRQIANLQDQLKRQLSKVTAAELEQISPELQDLRKRRAELETSKLTAESSAAAAAAFLGQAQSELHGLPAKQVRFAQLQRELKVAETAYDDLLAQAQVLRIQQAAAVANAYVLSRPEVPTDPVSPNAEKNMLAGCLVGLLMGLVVALIADRMDDTFRNPKEMERLLKLPVLGLVRMKLEGDPIILTQADERSPFAEAFRTLRANMRFSAVDGRAHTILITSSGAGEGKSTCAANLAIESARAGQRVVIVDTDLRRPALHTYFGLEGSPGVTNVLLGDTPLEEALQDTEVPGLRLLSAGALPPNPVLLIESEAMQQLIERLVADADLVIFDSPPVLVAADAQVLSSFFDGTLLVVETRTAKRDMAVRSMELLRRANARPIGVAINKARQREQGYYYYYYYHYNYYYADRSAKKGGNGTGGGAAGAGQPGEGTETAVDSQSSLVTGSDSGGESKDA